MQARQDLSVLDNNRNVAQNITRNVDQGALTWKHPILFSGNVTATLKRPSLCF